MWRPLLPDGGIVFSDQALSQPILEEVPESIGVLSGEHLWLLVEYCVSVWFFENQLIFKPITIPNLFRKFVALFSS